MPVLLHYQFLMLYLDDIIVFSSIAYKQLNLPDVVLSHLQQERLQGQVGVMFILQQGVAVPRSP